VFMGQVELADQPYQDQQLYTCNMKS
jgi:hypothetical protein